MIAATARPSLFPPRLETVRLTLAAHELTDFEPMAAMWADPDVVRHLSGRPSSRQESWSRLLRYRGLWPLLGYGYWAVREKGSDAFLGEVGFADFHRGLEPSIDGVPEAGWVFARVAHGRGYAREAVTAAFAWFDAQALPKTTVCLIGPANSPSIRVAQSQGFGDPRRVASQGKESLLFTRTREKN